MFKYDLTKIINREEQFIDFIFLFKDRIIDKSLVF